MLVFLNEYDCVIEFSMEFELHKIAIDLQQIFQWFGYDVVITCEVVSKDKLNDIEQGREEPNPPPSLDITGKKFETATVSAQQIDQQVERATQSITDQLVDHVNQQVGCLEAIVSKNTNLNDDRQDENSHDRYHPIEVTQDV